jgi:aminopeptidase
MMDPRIEKLADLLVNYSCEAKAGENILIEAIDVPHEFTSALVRAAAKAGATPVVMLKSNQVNRTLMLNGTLAQWDLVSEIEKLQMGKMHCYIGARGNANISELSDVPAE